MKRQSLLILICSTLYINAAVAQQAQQRSSSMSQAKVISEAPAADVAPAPKVEAKKDMPVLSADLQKQLQVAENKMQIRKSEILNNNDLSQEDKSRLVNEIESKKEKFLIEAMGEEGYQKYRMYQMEKKKYN
jgi:hypothetical protein